MSDQFDIIVRNGTVVDGTGAQRYHASIGIQDGKITAIGEILGSAKEVIDAQGKIVAPGAIDTHTHYDAQIFRDPTCADGGQNGVTSVVMTNCGFGFAPCRTEHRDRYMLMMENVEQIPVAHQAASLPWDWVSFPEFLESLGRTEKAVNVMAYVPLNALMIFVMGIDAAKTRPATEDELAEMKRLLGEAMDAGALGVSCSFLGGGNVHLDYDGTPMPCDVMDSSQLVEIATVLKDRGDGIIQCLSGLVGHDATVEVSERLARATGRPVIHNVIVANDHFPVHKPGLQWLDDMEAQGLEIWAASFCHRIWTEITLDTLTIFDSDPAFRELTYAGSVENSMKLLKDEDYRTRLREAYNPANFLIVGGDLERFVPLSVGGSVEHQDIEGKLLGESAKARGMNVVDLFADIILHSNGTALFKSACPMAKDPGIINELFNHRKVIPGGSDGGAHLKIFSGDHYVTDFLVDLVRERKIVSLEEAHYKLSGAPKEALRIANRGTIALGAAADIIVYDLDELFCDTEQYGRAFDLPDGDWRTQPKAGGYDVICVNGKITFRAGKHTGECPGTVAAQAA